jgi:hypothetical protein
MCFFFFFSFLNKHVDVLGTCVCARMYERENTKDQEKTLKRTYSFKLGWKKFPSTLSLNCHVHVLFIGFFFFFGKKKNTKRRSTITKVWSWSIHLLSKKQLKKVFGPFIFSLSHKLVVMD